jgi:Icc protein
MEGIVATIAQISDCHFSATTKPKFIAGCIAVLEHIATNPVDLLVVSGDIADDVCAEAYREIGALVTQILPTIPVVWVPGNHDDPAVMEVELRQPLIREWAFPGWKLAFLNSAVPRKVWGRIGEQQLTRFANWLTKTTDYVGIFVHHPPEPVGTEWIDPQCLRDADKLAEIIAANQQVKWLANGHVHQEKTATFASVDWYCTPATSRQFQAGAVDFALDKTLAPGYRHFSLNADGSYHTEVRRVGVID